MTDITGIEPQRIYVGRGYRGHNYPKKHPVYRSGQKCGIFGTIKKELRRRNVVETVIGHLKSDGHPGSNYLKGTPGDQQSTLFTVAGYNFRLLLKWLRKRFCSCFSGHMLIEKLARYAKLYFYHWNLQPKSSF